MGREALNADEIVLEIHRCTLAPENWTATIGKIAALVRAQNAHLITPGSDRSRQLLHAVCGGHEEALDVYVRHYHDCDPFVAGSHERGDYHSSKVFVDDQLFDRRLVKKSPFFADCCWPFDLDRAVTTCVIDEHERDGTPPTALTLFRRLGKPSFEVAEVKLLRHLAPHLTAAIRGYWRWDALLAGLRLVTTALDAVNAAVFAIKESGELSFANFCGETELSSKNWLENCGGRLAPSRHIIEPRDLEIALRRLRRGQGFSLHVRSNKASSPAVITGAPFHATAQGHPIEKSIALVWLVLLRLDPQPLQIVAELFRLSAAETRLLERLADGEALKDAAAILDIAENTARTQLKSIFAKTGRRRQSELLALVNRIAAFRFSAHVPRLPDEIS